MKSYFIMRAWDVGYFITCYFKRKACYHIEFYYQFCLLIRSTKKSQTMKEQLVILSTKMSLINMCLFQ